MDDKYDVRSSEMWEDVRFQVAAEGGGLTVFGPMALFETPSRMLSAADLHQPEARSQLARFGRRQFREVVHPGAFTKSLSEQPDIVLHYQHNENSLPLARTKAGTLRFEEQRGRVESTADLPDNEWGRPVRDAVARGDIGGISFRMGKVLDKWSHETIGDYTGPVRHLQEIQLRREVSLVTFPGYDTPASIRSLAEDAEVPPDMLMDAFNTLRTPDAKLTAEQKDALMSAINTRVDAPFIDPTVTEMRERLAVLRAG